MINRLVLLAAVMCLPVFLVAQASQAPAQPGTAETKPAPPSGRQPVQAKSQAEYQAYQSAFANTQNAQAMEHASDDFAAKFPDSELRVLLYRTAMHSYQTVGNSEKMMEMGLKVLAIDKDDPEALIGVAEVQEEHTSPSDLDRDERMTQAITNARHALETIDTDLAVPGGIPPDRVEAYKKYLRSTALAIIGTIQYKREQYADAETNLRKAIETDASNPDAVVILRLTLALDQEKKYPEALQQANRAVELTQEDNDIGKMARNERDRLMIQTGKSNAPGGSNAPGNTPGAAPGSSAPPAETAPGSTTPPANAPQNPAPPSH
jgi:tetratricopeptide (TPR) repeat protein